MLPVIQGLRRRLSPSMRDLDRHLQGGDGAGGGGGRARRWSTTSRAGCSIRRSCRWRGGRAPGSCSGTCAGAPATMMDDDLVRATSSPRSAPSSAERLAAARAAGCHETWADPGIGFGKRLEHNLALLRALPALRARLGVPLMVGVSRKAFIGQLTGKPARERQFGTAAAVTAAVLGGAAAVRVHDVAAMRDVVKVALALVPPSAQRRRDFPAPAFGLHCDDDHGERHAQAVRHRRHPRRRQPRPDDRRGGAAPRAGGRAALPPRRRGRGGSSSARTRACRATCSRARCRPGIVSAGADVMLVGPLPTPGIAFITSSMRADAGVVISASHNPVPGQRHQDLRRRRLQAARRDRGGASSGAWRRSAPATTARAPSRTRSARRCASRTRSGRYVQFLKHAFPKELHARRHRRSSSTARTAPPTRSRRRCSRSSAPRSSQLNVEPDGRNINDDCGALHPEAMARGGAARGRARSASRSTATPIA